MLSLRSGRTEWASCSWIVSGSCAAAPCSAAESQQALLLTLLQLSWDTTSPALYSRVAGWGVSPGRRADVAVSPRSLISCQHWVACSEGRVSRRSYTRRTQRKELARRRVRSRRRCEAAPGCAWSPHTAPLSQRSNSRDQCVELTGSPATRPWPQARRSTERARPDRRSHRHRA